VEIPPETIKKMSSFPEINKLCNVTSRWKYIQRNILTIHGPLNVKFSNVKLILKWILKKGDWNMWSAKIWLATGESDGPQ